MEPIYILTNEDMGGINVIINPKTNQIIEEKNNNYETYLSKIENYTFTTLKEMKKAIKETGEFSPMEINQMKKMRAELNRFRQLN